MRASHTSPAAQAPSARFEAIAAVLLEFYDRSDWSGVDLQRVDRVGHVLGVLATSAATAVGTFSGPRGPGPELDRARPRPGGTAVERVSKERAG